jgi:hypothetical protein
VTAVRKEKMAAIIWLATDISLCAESNIDSVGLFAADMRALGASNINMRLNFRLRSIGLAAERVVPVRNRNNY